jgi:putative ABC transport system ATP-binding protein
LELSVLQVDALHKRFPPAAAIADALSLHLASGQSMAILGKSGSGKSTLLKIIAGLETADRGSIEFDQHFLHQMDDTKRTQFRRQQIGMVFQFFELFDGLTVYENLCLPLQLNRIKVQRRVVMDALAVVGLADHADRLPHLLSGGEQQRLAVQRALIHQPRLVLADEPTGNLDAINGAQVMNLLIDACKSNGASLLMVTHATDLALRLDHQLQLVNGRLEQL